MPKKKEELATEAMPQEAVLSTSVEELPVQAADTQAALPEATDTNEGLPVSTIPVPKRQTRRKKAIPAETEPDASSSAQAPQDFSALGSILTITPGGSVERPDDQEAAAWHEIRSAYLTHRILTGTLSGLEPTEAGVPIAVVSHNGYRVAIPLSEMMLDLSTGPNRYGDMSTRQSKILGNMMGAEVDFVIRGMDTPSRSIVASRREAMMRKRQRFYFEADSQGGYRIQENQVVQARVIAVAEKVVRVEVFGVECSILARDLSYHWLGDARDYYHVGDAVLVRIQQILRESPETLRIHADVKSVSDDRRRDDLKKCRIQGKYAGIVTDVHKGVVFLRLHTGVSAIAHSCYDGRMPTKKDEVSFVVTKLDEEQQVAVGIITRIIRRNL